MGSSDGIDRYTRERSRSALAMFDAVSGSGRSQTNTTSGSRRRLERTVVAKSVSSFEASHAICLIPSRLSSISYSIVWMLDVYASWILSSAYASVVRPLSGGTPMSTAPPTRSGSSAHERTNSICGSRNPRFSALRRTDCAGLKITVIFIPPLVPEVLILSRTSVI